jgi:hypothetical protein
MSKTGCGMVARRPGGQLRRAGWSRGRALPLGRGRRGGWRAACTWVRGYTRGCVCPRGRVQERLGTSELARGRGTGRCRRRGTGGGGARLLGGTGGGADEPLQRLGRAEVRGSAREQWRGGEQQRRHGRFTQRHRILLARCRRHAADAAALLPPLPLLGGAEDGWLDPPAWQLRPNLRRHIMLRPRASCTWGCGVATCTWGCGSNTHMGHGTWGCGLRV